MVIKIGGRGHRTRFQDIGKTLEFVDEGFPNNSRILAV